MLPLTGNTVGVGGVMNNNSVPFFADRLNLLKALGCILELPVTRHAVLVVKQM